MYITNFSKTYIGSLARISQRHTDESILYTNTRGEKQSDGTISSWGRNSSMLILALGDG